MDRARLATIVLDQLRHACRVSIGETKVLDVDNAIEYWSMSAVSADGAERWSARGVDYYQTACGRTCGREL